MIVYDTLIGPFAEYEFMRRALAGAMALAFGAGPVGVFLMLRRMSLMGDAMAHAILPGAAAGFLVAGLNLFAMTAGGLIAGLLVALLAGAIALATYSWDCGRFGCIGHLGNTIGRALSLFPRRLPCVVIHPADVARGFLEQALSLIDSLMRWSPSRWTGARAKDTGEIA